MRDIKFAVYVCVSVFICLCVWGTFPAILLTDLAVILHILVPIAQEVLLGSQKYGFLWMTMLFLVANISYLFSRWHHDCINTTGRYCVSFCADQLVL